MRPLCPANFHRAREPVYWIPPGAIAAFSGPKQKVAELLKVFKKGNFKVKAVEDTRAQNLAAAPVLTFFIRALEANGWSLAKLKKSPLLNHACLAMQEAIAINAARINIKSPSVFWITPHFFRGLLKLTKFLVPFDLETYLRVHFTKVQTQMHQSLKDYANEGTRA